ncbi:MULTISPECIES: MATE family efflux transporter [unclassified Mycoplasma]
MNIKAIENDKYFKQKYNFKYLLRLSFPIFIQTLFFATVTIAGSLAVSFYNRVYHADGSYNGYYFYTFAKIFVVYKIITFLPLLFQLGVLVVASNLYGQGKQKEIAKLLWSAFYLSLILNGVIYLIVFFSAPKLLSLSGAKNTFIIGWKKEVDYNNFISNLKKSNLKLEQVYQLDLNHKIFVGGFADGINYIPTNVEVEVKNEHSFAIKFLRIGTIDIFITSIAFIMNSSLQAIKKNKLAIIGVIVGTIVRTIWIFMILFVIKNAFLASLEIIIGSLINIVISSILVKKYVVKNHKIKFKETWNNKYIKEILKIGFPISLETGIWFVSQYLLSKAIPDAKLNDRFIGLWRALNNIYDLFAAYLLALSYVTSSVVATQIGKNKLDKAKKIGNLAYKTGFIVQLLFGILGIILTYPLFKIYSIETKLINQYCYILMSVFAIKSLMDVGPLTTLRSLWGANDVWMPNLISIFTMIGLQTSFVYILILFGSNNISQEIFLISLSSIAIIDPLFRTLLYLLRWNTDAWKKFAKKL